MDTFLNSMGAIYARVFNSTGTDLLSEFLDVGNISAGAEDRKSCDALDQTLLNMAAIQRNPAIGLLSAGNWHPADLGTLGFAWLSSPTLRAGFKRLERYGKILGSRVTPTYYDDEHGLVICVSANRENSNLDYFFVDFCMALLLSMCRKNLSENLSPIRVQLARDRPNDPIPYELLFACPIEFNAKINAFTLKSADVDLPLTTSNIKLSGLFDELLIQEYANANRQDLIAHCRAEILNLLMDGQISEKLIAKKMLMSHRTLQRRLNDLNTSFKHLVDNVRHEQTMRYLKEKKISITEIAFLVGFASSTTLARAVTRWTGVAPRQWRTSFIAKQALM